jgi:hypothetical protein
MAAPKAIRSGDLISYHLKHVCTDNRKQELCWKGWNFRKELLKLHLTCVLPGSDSSVIILVIFCVRSVLLLLRELLVRVRRRTVMLLLLPCCVCCLMSSRPGGGQGRAAAAGAAAWPCSPAPGSTRGVGGRGAGRVGPELLCSPPAR